MQRHADHFLRVASGYPYVNDLGVVEVAENQAVVWIDIAVELPNDARVDGQSSTGVKAVERVQVVLRSNYPRQSPSFRLRTDFPPNMPHLAPGDGKTLPEPCLVDGSPDEFFSQHDLLDAGIFAVLDQMGIWFKRAAIGTLANETHGWEPINRNSVLSEIVVDRDHVLAQITGKNAGNTWLNARYIRRLFEIMGEDNLGLWVGRGIAPKIGDLKPIHFSLETREEPGATIAALLWPAEKSISKDILPETVTTVLQLEERADAYGLGDQFRQLVRDLDRRFETYTLPAPIPVAVIFCVRRPFWLMGRSSPVELIPFWFNLHRTEAHATRVTRPDDPVLPGRQVDMPSPALFRHVSGSDRLPQTSLVGCGSVGSKLALHLARAGARILAVSDNALLNPHNMARHALARHPFPMLKAVELAAELGRLGDTPGSHFGNVITALEKPVDRDQVVPSGTELVINTTASRLVREALAGGAGGKVAARVAEVALFGRGNGAFVFREGEAGNPSLVQLEAAMYASTSPVERQLLFDPATGLAQVQIGDGCGSMTMPMTDARLSAMTAMATEELVWMVTSAPLNPGHVSIGVRDAGKGVTTWRRTEVAPFHRVPVKGGDWTLHLSDDVVRRIKEDIAANTAVETGGLLIGTCNSRLRCITVVDILPAPQDSLRAAGLFVLGINGLKASVDRRYTDSGGSLFDVGTWHSHLADQDASGLDWQTAKTLAQTRPPPAVLLICTPKRFLAITGTNGH